MPRLPSRYSAPSRYVRQMPSSGRIFAYAVIIVALALLPLFLSNMFGWDGLLRSVVLPLAALLTFGLILTFSMLHMQPRVLFGQYGGRLVPAFAAIVGLGIFAFVTDYTMRVTTLYETFLRDQTARRTVLRCRCIPSPSQLSIPTWSITCMSARLLVPVPPCPSR
jgi:hypothetical protein